MRQCLSSDSTSEEGQRTDQYRSQAETDRDIVQLAGFVDSQPFPWVCGTAKALVPHTFYAYAKPHCATSCD